MRDKLCILLLAPLASVLVLSGPSNAEPKSIPWNKVRAEGKKVIKK